MPAPIFTVLSALVALAAVPATAHIQMIQPPPIQSRDNPYKTNQDYDYTSPLNAATSGIYPCRGHLADLNGPAGQSVATWQAGSTQQFKTDGSATHGGGSCQLSFSFDGGQTFRVIKTIIGRCTLQDTWDFQVPPETPSGNALFAWTWFNTIGQREMYMNCAAVTIEGGGPAGSLDSRPEIFKANIDNGCSTIEGKDVLIPDPGPVVENYSTVGTLDPVGTCGSGSGSPPNNNTPDTNTLLASSPNAVISEPQTAQTDQSTGQSTGKATGQPPAQSTDSTTNGAGGSAGAGNSSTQSGKKCKSWAQRRVRRHKRSAPHSGNAF